MASRKPKKRRRRRPAPKLQQRTQLPAIGQVDGRSTEAIVFKRLCAAFISDKGGEVSTAELELARRASGLGVLCGLFESKMLRAEPYTVEEAQNYQAAASSQSRILIKLGLQRRAKTVPTFADLAAMPIDPPTPAQEAAAADREEDQADDDLDDKADAEPVVIDQDPVEAAA